MNEHGFEEAHISQITALSTPSARPAARSFASAFAPAPARRVRMRLGHGAGTRRNGEAIARAHICTVVPSWETSIERVAGGPVPPGDRPMASGMTSAMVPKATLLSAVAPRR